MRGEYAAINAAIVDDPKGREADVRDEALVAECITRLEDHSSDDGRDGMKWTETWQQLR